MNFFVYSPSYDDNSGGVIVLHRLVHLINEHTEDKAFLVPRKLEKIDISSLRKIFSAVKLIYIFKKEKFLFKVNKNWNTPVAYSLTKDNLDKDVIIYPEVTFGNPLEAKNVVRWLLHQPGHFTKEINFGLGELYFKFNSAIKDFILYGSMLSKNDLKVINYPINFYNLDNITEERIGTCYTIRKGQDKNKIHDENSICIDGMSHEEIACIFKRVKIFISYDDYTAYSLFAILCGCKSIVVPSDKVSIDEWYPDIEDRYGIAYGFDEEQMQWADDTKNKVRERIEREHKLSEKNVINCVHEIKIFFGID